MSGVNWNIKIGDVESVELGDGFDACFCDPPYGLSFMGKAWDHGVPSADIWRRVFDALKPGAHLLAFGGTRTYHRLTVAIEDAGFEIRDCLMYLYGSGFPKSHNIAWNTHIVASKSCGVMVEYDQETEASDAKGVEQNTEHSLRFVQASYLQTPVYACAECGQVLQPFVPEQNSSQYRAAWEKSEIVWPEQSSVEGWRNLETSKGQLSRCEICQMSHGFFADGSEGWIYNGASSSDGEIPWQIANADGSCSSYRPQSVEQLHRQSDAISIERRAQTLRGYGTALKPAWEPIILARKPIDGTVSNNAIVHGCGGINVDGCRIEHDEECKMLPDQHGDNAGSFYRQGGRHKPTMELKPEGRWPSNVILDDSIKLDGAERFFYSAKASRSERDYGLDAFETRPAGGLQGARDGTIGQGPPSEGKNVHPTVKPLSLTEYLARLILPPKRDTDRRLLIPFSGSGSEMIGALKSGWDFVQGVELSAEYAEIAEARIKAHTAQQTLDFE